MFINNIHILYYVAFGILGLIVGKIIGKYDNKIIKERGSSKNKDENKEKISEKILYYFTNIIIALIYIGLLYYFGLERELINNLKLFQYLILTPFLVSITIIDMKLKIIPNRLVLILFEIGIIFVFIYGMYDINIAVNRILGGVVGLVIFFVITLIGKLISDEEVMGFGDVKFVGALGLFFGLTQIMYLSILSFIIGAVISIVLIVVKRKKMNEYIAFGPFISLASFTLMFIPYSAIINTLLKIG